MIGHGFRWSLLSPVFRHVCLYVSASLTLSGRPLSRSIPPSLSLPLSLSQSFSLCRSPSVSLFASIPLSLFLSVFLSLSLYLSLSLPLFALPFYLSIYLPIHIYIYVVSICVYIYISISLSLSLPHSHIKAPLLGCQISQVRIVYVGDREGEVVSVGWCWLPKSNTNPPLRVRGPDNHILLKTLLEEGLSSIIQHSGPLSERPQICNSGAISRGRGN